MLDSECPAIFRLLGMIGMMGTVRHDIKPNGFFMWHDGGMTGSMTVRLSCHSQADTNGGSEYFYQGMSAGVRRAFGRTSGRRTCRQRRRKKNHLIEAAPFGRLDQM